MSLVNIYMAWLTVMNRRQRNVTNAQIWGNVEWLEIWWQLYVTSYHVTSSFGLRNFKGTRFLLERVYIYVYCNEEAVNGMTAPNLYLFLYFLWEYHLICTFHAHFLKDRTWAWTSTCMYTHHCKNLKFKRWQMTGK